MEIEESEDDLLDLTLSEDDDIDWGTSGEFFSRFLFVLFDTFGNTWLRTYKISSSTIFRSLKALNLLLDNNKNSFSLSVE